MRRVKAFERMMLDNGLLFEINRKVLHPLGLALVIDLSYDNRKKLVISGLMETDDAEGFLFDEETFDLGKEKFDRFMKKIGQKKIDARLKTVGCIEQKVGDVKPQCEKNISIDGYIGKL
jgi:hypothetical protein